MNKTRFLAATFAAGLLTLSTATAANATYAPQALEADAPGVVAPGAQFNVQFDSEVNCAWTSTFNGQNGTPGNGKSYSPSFTAPQNDGVYTATGYCTWDPANPTVSSLAPTGSNVVTPAIATTSSTSNTLLAVPQTDVITVQVRVGDPSDGGSGDDSDNGSDDGSGSDDESGDESGSGSGSGSDNANGILPDTGGESLALVVAGGALVAVGAGAVVATRRRKTA
jgi:LPXTG-motif cell wall-anchored protein